MNQETLAAWMDLTSRHPTPWYLDRCNSSGVEVRDTCGNVVFMEDFSCGPEIGPNLAESIAHGAVSLANFLVKFSQHETP